MNTKNEYKQAKNRAEIFYDRVKKIYCPALKTDVRFTSVGFHHLRYDGSLKERKKDVQLAKFRFLKDATEVLEKSNTIQEYRRNIVPVGGRDKGGFRKTKMVEWFSLFAVTSFSKQYRIKVILRRIGGENGNYHFWSVIPFWTLTNGARHIGSKSIEDS